MKTIIDLLEAHNKFDGLSFKLFLDSHGSFVKQYDNTKDKTKTAEYNFCGVSCQYTIDKEGYLIESRINI